MFFVWSENSKLMNSATDTRRSANQVTCSAYRNGVCYVCCILRAGAEAQHLIEVPLPTSPTRFWYDFSYVRPCQVCVLVSLSPLVRISDETVIAGTLAAMSTISKKMYELYFCAYLCFIDVLCVIVCSITTRGRKWHQMCWNYCTHQLRSSLERMCTGS